MVTGRAANPESLGRILQQARLVHGWSQRELAERLGTSQRYIWEIEAGKPSIFIDRLFAYLRETGAELSVSFEPPPVPDTADSTGQRDTGQDDHG